jgi:hypothetical protein
MIDSLASGLSPHGALGGRQPAVTGAVSRHPVDGHDETKVGPHRVGCAGSKHCVGPESQAQPASVRLSSRGVSRKAARSTGRKMEMVAYRRPPNSGRTVRRSQMVSSTTAV